MFWCFLLVLQMCVFGWYVRWLMQDPGSYRAWVADGVASIVVLGSGVALSTTGYLPLRVYGAGMALVAIFLLRRWWKKRPPRQRTGAAGLLGAKSRAMREVVLRRMREAGDGLRRPLPVSA
jgi:hypothetical protein